MLYKKEKLKGMDKFADDKAKLFDIVRSIEEVQGITNGVSFERFSKDNDITNDIAYQLREVGMAASRLSEEFKTSYGDVDWDVLTNLQFATWDQELEFEPNSLWYIVKKDLPRIHDQVMDITTVLEDRGEQEDGGTFFY